MRNMSLVQLEKLIAPVIERAFPGVEPEVKVRWSQNIANEFSIAASVEELQRSDRNPSRDIESIEKAAKALKRAAGHLNEIGYEGGKAVGHIAEKINDWRDVMPTRRHLSPTSNGRQIGELLSEVSSDLTASAARVDRTAKPIFAELESNPSKATRPTKPAITTARHTARECARAFLELSGKQPRTRYDSVLKERYGPYRSFVKAVFDALGVPGKSLDTAADEARAWLSHHLSMQESSKK